MIKICFVRCCSFDSNVKSRIGRIFFWIGRVNFMNNGEWLAGITERNCDFLEEFQVLPLYVLGTIVLNDQPSELGNIDNRHSEFYIRWLGE